MKNNRRELVFILLGLVVILCGIALLPKLIFVKEFDEFSLVDEETLNKVNTFNAGFDAVEETSILILEKPSLWVGNADYNLLDKAVRRLENAYPDHKFYAISNFELIRKRGFGYRNVKLFEDFDSSDIPKLKANYSDIFSKFESQSKLYALIFIESNSRIKLDEMKYAEELKALSPELKVHFFNRSGFIKELNSLSYNNLIWNTIAVLAMLLLAFYIFTRSLKPMVLIGFVLMVNLAFLVIYAVLLEIQISPQLSSLPALIVILIFSDCIHITWALQNYEKSNLKQMLLPLTLTSLTNCIGFLFFIAVSENDILFELSVLSVLSIVSSLLVSLYVLFRFKFSQWNYRVDRLIILSVWLEKIIRSLRGKFVMPVLSVLMIAGSFVVITYINIERNFDTKSELPFSNASEILQNHFFGTHQLTIEVDINSQNKFTELGVTHEMDIVEKTLDTLFEALYISSPNEIIKRFNRFYRYNTFGSYELPKTLEGRKLKDFHKLKNMAGWKEVVNTRTNTGKITIGHNLSDLTKRMNSYREFEKRLSNNRILNFNFISLSYFQDKEELSFLNHVFAGFTILFLMSSILIFLLKRSWLTAVKFLIANVIPLCFALVLMVVFSVPLNSSSFLMLSVLLGVSLDDSIYYIYKNSLSKIQNSLQIPIILTSIVLAFGMLGFFTSSYSWIQPFSIILALSFLLSLLLDMLLLDHKT